MDVNVVSKMSVCVLVGGWGGCQEGHALPGSNVILYYGIVSSICGY